MDRDTVRQSVSELIATTLKPEWAEKWWDLPNNTDLGGRTPRQALDEGDLEGVQRAAYGLVDFRTI